MNQVGAAPQPPPRLGQAHGRRGVRRRWRQAQARRAERRVRMPVPKAVREGADPLVHALPEPRQRWLNATLAALAGCALHVLLVLGLWGLGGLFPKVGTGTWVTHENLSVTVMDMSAADLAATEAAEVGEAVGKPEPKPEAPPKPKPKPKPRPPRESPPPDPIDQPKVAAKKPPPKKKRPKRRRIVGLTYDSTVPAGGAGGGGPVFAVGETRMGATARRAADPEEIRRREAARLNEVTKLDQVAGGRYVLPRRIEPADLNYPAALERQGIEGDVVVQIRLNAQGKVISARVVSGSSYAAFNEAALVTARKERFMPALRDGVPVPYTLKYVYRFRLSDF